MKYILLSSGFPSSGTLNINIDADSEASAKEIAGTFAKRLHLAGWYSHSLFSEEGDMAAHIISFRTETEEPSIVLTNRKG